MRSSKRSISSSTSLGRVLCCMCCFTWNMDHVLDFLYINPGYRFCKQGGLFWDRGPRFSGQFLWQKQGEGRSSSNRGQKWPSPLRGPAALVPGARPVPHAWRPSGPGARVSHLVARPVPGGHRTLDPAPGNPDRGPGTLARGHKKTRQVAGLGVRGPGTGALLSHGRAVQAPWGGVVSRQRAGIVRIPWVPRAAGQLHSDLANLPQVQGHA